jgi:hypothetical protein
VQAVTNGRACLEGGRFALAEQGLVAALHDCDLAFEDKAIWLEDWH